MSDDKYLDLTGLQHFKEKLDETFVDQDHAFTNQEIIDIFNAAGSGGGEILIGNVLYDVSYDESRNAIILGRYNSPSATIDLSEFNDFVKKVDNGWIIGQDAETGFTISYANTAAPVFNIKSGGRGAAFFGDAAADGAVDINGALYINGTNLTSSQYGYVMFRNVNGDYQTSIQQGNNHFRIYDVTHTKTILQQSQNEYLYTDYPLRVQGHSSAIGSVLASAKQTTSIANQTTTSGATITVTKGKWLVQGYAVFDVNATGPRQASVNKGSGAAWNADNIVYTQAATGGSKTALQVQCIFDAVDNDVFKVWLWQGSGSTLSCDTIIKAIRLQ